MTTSARVRRAAIRELLARDPVRSQEELLLRLERRGIHATQPVLSRDLRSLHVVKRDGLYSLLEEERVTPLQTLKSLLRGCEEAGPNLVLVRCEPGAASAVARALEAEQIPGLVGTVAGDDTIFAAVRSATAGRQLRRTLEQLAE